MKKKFSFVAAILIGSRLLAQEDSTFKFLDEVVFTAAKYPKKLSETGKVLTIINRAQLERSGGKDLARLLNEQAGLIINGATSNPGKDKNLFLQGAVGKYTVILIDGIPLSDPSGAGGAFDLRLLSIDQVERIEILKGSQSTLFGSDAIAGVINIITRQGGKKPMAANGLLSYGQFNTFKGGAGINGRAGKFDYNLNYTYLTTDGISEASAEKAPAGTSFDKDGNKQHAVQANFGIQASTHLRIKPFVRYNSFKGEYDDDAFTDGKNTNTSDLFNAGLQAIYQMADGSLNLNYGYDHTNRTFEGAFSKYEFKGRSNNAEVFLHQTIARHIMLLAGFNYQQLKMLDTTSTKKDPSVHFTSPYASLFLSDLEGFYMEAGARYNVHSQYGNNFTYSLNPSYLLSKKIKLFVNYSTGFRAPSLYELYGKFGHNDNLKPEKSNSLNAGIEAFPAQQALSVRALFFTRKIQDAIVYTFTNGYINQDEQKDHGFETEVRYNNKKINVQAFYAFVDGDVTTKTATGKDTTYFNLIRRPRHSFGLTLGYQFIPALYIGSHVQTFSKRTDIFYNPANFYSAEEVSLDAYTLLDIYAEYKLLKEKLTLFADAKNITGTKFTEVYGYDTPGFNIMAGLKIKL